MPLLSTKGATQITSRVSLLISYWPMAFVLGATSERRNLLVYGRIPPRIRPYTWKYTAVYLEVYGRILEVYGERFALNLTWCVPLACACVTAKICPILFTCLRTRYRTH